MMFFRFRRPVLAVAAILILTLSGCSAGSSSDGGVAKTQTAVPTFPFTAPPTATPTPLPPPCTRATLRPSVAAQQGDLLLSPTFIAPADGPDAFLFQLPDGTPLSPLRLPAPDANGYYYGRPSSW